MFFVESAAGGRCLRVDLCCEVGDFRDGFEDDGVLRSFGWSGAPGEGRVIGDEDRGDFERIDILEKAGDDVAGVFFVGGGNFVVGHGIGDGNRAAKIVAVSGAEAGNGFAGLSPGGGVFGMSVADTADFVEGFVENEVSRKVGRRAQIAFDDFSVEIGDDQIFRLHFLVGDAAGLDDDEGVFAGDAASVAEGVENQSAANQFEIGFENFYTKTREKHGWRPT